jgi:hypothetical protein
MKFGTGKRSSELPERSPGPNISKPSTIGKQSESTKSTAPSFQFGAKETNDVHITKHGTLVRRPHTANVYGDASMISDTTSDWKRARAKTPDSRKGNIAEYSFGKGKRFLPGEIPTPNPGAIYDLPSSLGGIASSFPKGPQRTMLSKEVDEIPAPGTYGDSSNLSSVGKQTLSNQTSSPSFRFGSSTRMNTDSLYDSFGTGDGDLNASVRGKNVPGPGNYEAISVLASPLKKNSPAFSFGGKGVPRGEVIAKTNRIEVAPGDYVVGSGLEAQVYC